MGISGWDRELKLTWFPQHSRPVMSFSGLSAYQDLSVRDFGFDSYVHQYLPMQSTKETCKRLQST